MKKLAVICTAIPLLATAALLLWRHVDTDMRNADSQMAKLKGQDPNISSGIAPSDSPPGSLQESSENAEKHDDPANLSPEDQHRRLNEFFLDRYFPDLEKEAGFSPDDVDTLVRLKGSDEDDLERGLGSAKYQHWKEYEAKVLSREAVTKLGRNLSGDDQLSEDQASLLYRTILDERMLRDRELRSRKYAGSADPRMRVDFEMGVLEIREESDRRLLAAARGFLGEQQLAALPEIVVDPNVATQRAQLERLRAK